LGCGSRTAGRLVRSFDCVTIPQSFNLFEDADYEGQSLSALKRIAEALGRQVQIRFALKRIRRT
jgi:hypothetical protein